MVLVAWLPDYSLHLHADLIALFDLKLCVKYMGMESYFIPMETFTRYHNENKKVLFEMWTPSIFTAGNWSYISLPVDHQISDQVWGI